MIHDIIAILEDDAGRAGEMRRCLGEILPGREVVVFEAAGEMIAWLKANMGHTALISLDHDLPTGDGRNRGCGRDVADYLATVEATCPVIVHSSNADAASGMYWALKRAGWPVRRSYPRAELEWVKEDWMREVQGLVREGWIQG